MTMTDIPVNDIDVEETWVNVTEGAELMGYHRMTVYLSLITNSPYAPFVLMRTRRASSLQEKIR